MGQWNLSHDSHPGIKEGNVFILQHTLFDNVLKFGCTHRNPDDVAEELSSKVSMPGKFSVISAIRCVNPCKVKEKVVEIFKSSRYIDDFYEVPVDTALSIVKRESMRIPIQMDS